MKSVLVTGANSGFGYLIALKFARNGYKVYATTRSLEKEGVKELNEIAKKDGLDISWLVLDVTDNESIKSATKDINKLDVLVNNAGYGAIGLIDSFSDEDFLKQLDTNLIGIHRMVTRFLPVMKSQKSGKIINIASIAGRVTAPRLALYSSSKFGVEAYTEALRHEVGSFGISVCVVEPGTFNTGFGSNEFKGKESIEDGNKLWGKIEYLKKIFVEGFLKKKLNNPQAVADKIYDLANSRFTHLHNYVGTDSKIISFYRKWTPDILWDWLMRRVFK